MRVEEINECYNALDDIASLEDNWNNNGAIKFLPEHIEQIRQICKYLNYKPDIFPTACDSIQLEYEDNIKREGEPYRYLEFEIFKYGVIEWFTTKLPWANVIRFPVKATEKDIAKAINIIYDMVGINQ